jgi:hypothetical protein
MITSVSFKALNAKKHNFFILINGDAHIFKYNSSTTRSQVFLENRKLSVLIYSRNSPSLLQHEGSLPCPNQAATECGSSPRIFKVYFSKIHFNIMLPSTSGFFQLISSTDEKLKFFPNA